MALSQVSYKTAEGVLKAYGLTIVDKTEEICKNYISDNSTPLEPWPAQLTEPQATMPMIQRLKTLLNEANVPLDQKFGYELRDVHESKDLLNANLPTEKVEYHLGGGTDAIIVPYMTSSEGEHMARAIKVVFELKLKSTVKAKKTEAQAIVELLCAMAASQQQVFLFATDVCTTARIFWIDSDNNGNATVFKAEGVPVRTAVKWLAQQLGDVPLPQNEPQNPEISLGPSPLDRLLQKLREKAGESQLAEQLEVLADLPYADRIDAFAYLHHQHARSIPIWESMYT